MVSRSRGGSRRVSTTGCVGVALGLRLCGFAMLLAWSWGCGCGTEDGTWRDQSLRVSSMDDGGRNHAVRRPGGIEHSFIWRKKIGWVVPGALSRMENDMSEDDVLAGCWR
jgi:hypothetical protein